MIGFLGVTEIKFDSRSIEMVQTIEKRITNTHIVDDVLTGYFMVPHIVFYANEKRILYMRF